MILGIIPVGGVGLRLGLPFSKEMLPQKNYDYYNPIINHLVQKMELAGAAKIFFIHGSEIKTDIAKFFNSDKHIHIKQHNLGFARVFEPFCNYLLEQDITTGEVIFGLPDAYFDGNPFLPLLRNKNSLVCALFQTNDSTKVDRLNKEGNFDIKSVKTSTNQRWFWGAFKVSLKKLLSWHSKIDYNKTKEIGEILNSEKKSFVYLKEYLDLGTWDNLNIYWQSEINKENFEIERKYLASKITFKEFESVVKKMRPDNELDVTSVDYYFKPKIDNKIEFVRFRDSGNTGRSDLTIKTKEKSSFNRFELSIILNKNSTNNVLDFLQLLGLDFAFEVKKRCLIYFFKDYTIVLYRMLINNKELKFLEIELNKKSYSLVTKIEDSIKGLTGFDKSNIIKESKYEIISKLNEKSAC